MCGIATILFVVDSLGKKKIKISVFQLFYKARMLFVSVQGSVINRLYLRLIVDTTILPWCKLVCAELFVEMLNEQCHQDIMLLFWVLLHHRLM